MANATSKRMVLLSAYEELTRKETRCLVEENIDGLLKTQKKKAKVLEGMEVCPLPASDSEEASDFLHRIDALKITEKENSDRLATLMVENRIEFKKLERDSKFASKAVRAYGSPSEKKPSSGRLLDQA